MKPLQQAYQRSSDARKYETDGPVAGLYNAVRDGWLTPGWSIPPTDAERV